MKAEPNYTLPLNFKRKIRVPLIDITFNGRKQAALFGVAFLMTTVITFVLFSIAFNLPVAIILSLGTSYGLVSFTVSYAQSTNKNTGESNYQTLKIGNLTKRSRNSQMIISANGAVEYLPKRIKGDKYFYL